MSKSQIAASIAEKSQISKRQATEILDHIAELAYKHAKNTFTLPGIGKLVLKQIPSRRLKMQFGPKKGALITVPAKRVVKFRVSKGVKDAILSSDYKGVRAPAPGDEGDVTTPPKGPLRP